MSESANIMHTVYWHDFPAHGYHANTPVTVLSISDYYGRPYALVSFPYGEQTRIRLSDLTDECKPV